MAGALWNGHAITARFCIPSSARLRLKRLLLVHVLPSQKLKREPLFLHFCSIRTNKPNLGAKPENYYMPIPYV